MEQKCIVVFLYIKRPKSDHFIPYTVFLPNTRTTVSAKKKKKVVVASI